MDFIERVRKNICARQLINSADVIVVGVSGGPDSVALLRVLHQLKHEWGLRLVVAHAHHSLRPEATRDQAWVRKLAAKLQLPFATIKAGKRVVIKGSVEDWAREFRFEFLVKTARQHQATSIALAHTRDDLAETVLMRILRGSGLQGLRGILPERSIRGMHIIRPLLDFSKKEILDYLKSVKQDYCHDHTNDQTIFFRNQIRLELLPHLAKKYSPNIVKLLAQMADVVGADYEYLHAQAENFYKAAKRKSSSGTVALSIKMLKTMPVSIRRMVIRLAYEDVKGDLNVLTFDHLRDIENGIVSGTPRTEIHVSADIKAVLGKESLCIQRK